ncbi:uncharacterized protein FA14DRAFT_157001 [Meira miltonrushii]|uniref:Uncharacterized protein n=1 Tax=Meira miltonrushii TaxID=1280837 RepID=A0A316VFS7_9BASI|nr:uncharacterized protein FA14DRAFT_157001 [Meira miltonrushii]PWN34335.1 hypothetical protein FA14DRAFT_157001 [Meira miltonrushii]
MANESLTSPVPLSNDSVFIPATSPTSTRGGEGPETVDSAYTLRSNRARSDSATTTVDSQPGRSSIQLSVHTPRRSRAHQLSLLGLHSDGTRILEDGEGASEDVLLTGLSDRSTPNAKSVTTTSKFAMHQDESQFDIGHSSDDEEDEIRLSGLSQERQTGSRSAASPRQNGNYSNHNRQYDNSSTYDDLDLEAADYDPYDDEDDEYGHMGMGEVKLPFESTTKKERIWMWASTGVVIALSLVSIAIAVDWIDWPGDGIGKF